MDYINLDQYTDHDQLDRVTLLDSHDPYDYERGYIEFDDTYARIRVSRSRYQRHDPTPPVNAMGAEVVASADGELIYTGIVDHADFVVKGGVEYVELRCFPAEGR